MACKQTGLIHSLETFGTVDGPGIRLVVFFQGCPMRCLYCHNPDTWDSKKGRPVTVDEILELYEKNRIYYRSGGLTATGGEPLMQLHFLTELFEKAKEKGIHTCLDTSGILYREKAREDYIRLFVSTDLILLDLKHSDPEKHKLLTGHSQKAVLEFLDASCEANIPVIIRHVVVPGYTDSPTQLENLGKIIASRKNIKGLEVLPYHSMGEQKYKELNLEYPLKGLEDLSKEQAEHARRLLLDSIRQYRSCS